MPRNDTPNPLAGVNSADKTPAERAAQYLELQAYHRELEAQGNAHVDDVQQTSPMETAKIAEALQLKEVFEVAAPESVKVDAPKADPKEHQVFAQMQKPDGALFSDKGKEIEIIGNPWKVIPFGDEVPKALLDLKKPAGDYEFKVPDKAAKVKDDALFNLTAQPKNKGEAPQKVAVLVDGKGQFKGAEFKSPQALKKAIEQVPSFAQNLFGALFGESAKTAEPRFLRIASVTEGKSSAFDVKLERRNELTGVWQSAEATLNNFGQKVPPSPNSPRRFDLVVAQYHLDGFE